MCDSCTERIESVMVSPWVGEGRGAPAMLQDGAESDASSSKIHTRVDARDSHVAVKEDGIKFKKTL